MKARPRLASFPGIWKPNPAIILLAALSASPAPAATIYWDGTGTTWTSVPAWSTDSGAATPDPAAAPGIGDDVVFNISSYNTNSTIGFGAANQSALSLTFNNTGTTILGGGGNRDLILGGGGMTVAAGAGAVTVGSSGSGSNVFVRLAADQTWTNNSANGLTSRNITTGPATGTSPVKLTFSTTSTGAITNSGALNDGAAGAVVSILIDSPGSGTTFLNGGNYSGGTTIKSGVLSSGGALGTGNVLLGHTSGTGDARLNISGIAANNLTVQAGSGGTLALTGSGANDYTGDILLNNNLTVGSLSTSAQTLNISGDITGSGNLKVARLGSANPTVVLVGNSSYTGKTSVESATLVVSSLNSVAGGTATSSLGAPTTVANGTISLGAVAASTLRYAGTGESTDRVIDLAGTNLGVTLEQAGTGLLKFTSDLTTTGNGNKTLTLRGATAGTGEFGGRIANSTGTTALTKTDSGTWRLSGLNTYTGVTSITGGVLETTKLATGGQSSSIGASTNAAGNLSLSGGTLRYVGDGDSTDRRFTVGSAGATFDASGQGAVSFTNTTVPSHTATTENRSIVFTGTNTADNTMAATIGNAGTGLTSIVKEGSGKWILSGNNTYTGNTTINAGKLVINGNSSTATGNVSVSAGATLGGGGTLGGATTISGILAPGNSIGTLSVNNDVTWNGAATAGSSTDWQFELGLSNASDLLDITGAGSDFLKGPGTIFRFDFLGATDTGTYKLVDWTNTTDFVFTDFSYTNLGGGNTGTFSITGSQLNFTVVPEPSASALISGLGVICLMRRRR